MVFSMQSFEGTLILQVTHGLVFPPVPRTLWERCSILILNKGSPHYKYSVCAFDVTRQVGNDKILLAKLYWMIFLYVLYIDHPWIKEDGEAPDTPLDNAVLNRLKQFRAMNQFKKAALRVCFFFFPRRLIIVCKQINRKIYKKLYSK